MRARPVVARRGQREIAPLDCAVEEDGTDPGICYAEDIEQFPL
jgi:hypothetical protein